MTRHAAVAITVLLVVSTGSVVTLGVSAPSAEAGAYDDGRWLDAQGYEVTFSNVTIVTWRLVNVTVTNVSVTQLTVENASSGNETVENETVENASLTELHVREAVLRNVTADRLVVRNRSIIEVPGGDIVPPKFEGRTIDRHVLKNITVDGTLIENLTVDNATVTETIQTNESAATEDEVAPPEPDVGIWNASVEDADVRNATAEGLHLESSAENETDEATQTDDAAQV